MYSAQHCLLMLLWCSTAHFGKGGFASFLLLNNIDLADFSACLLSYIFALHVAFLPFGTLFFHYFLRLVICALHLHFVTFLALLCSFSVSFVC